MKKQIAYLVKFKDLALVKEWKSHRRALGGISNAMACLKTLPPPQHSVLRETIAERVKYNHFLEPDNSLRALETD